MAGYSGTPLVKKLGLKEGFRVAFPGAPEGFDATLGPLPEGAAVDHGTVGVLDAAVLFARSRGELSERFPGSAARVGPFGTLWVAWPKKSSGVATDLTENVVRDVGLSCGLVDVKVCAIDDTWSGLKFVTRLQDRPRKKKA
jgi:hypothetical protein